MRILSWIAGIAVCGLGMIVIGILDRRDGLTIGGSIFIGSAVIATAVLASAKK
jgi:hypothetical protein